jgi:hypothetical protein
MGNKTLTQDGTPDLRMSPAYPDHAYALANSLRAIDKFEIRANYPNYSEAEGLRQGIGTSGESFVISTFQDSTIHGLWGHGPWASGLAPTGLGYVWLVSDEELFSRFGKTITKVARKEVFPTLDLLYPSGYGNLVYKENDLHLRWLSSCGFNARGIFNLNQFPFVLMMRTPK